MKMSKEHYEALKASFKQRLADECERLKGTTFRNIKTLLEFHESAYSELTPRRMCFDLLYWVGARDGSISGLLHEFYKYGNDDHIFTAIKSIIKELKDEHYKAPARNINEDGLKWAQQHDWYSGFQTDEHMNFAIWAVEDGKLHPWPFWNLEDLKQWAEGKHHEQA